MNEQTNDLTESCINKFHELSNLFKEKNKQYGDKDHLANFRNGAMLQYGDDSWEHMYETAKSYCLKHVAHVFGAGQTINDEKISESLGDIAVYCIIMHTWLRAISRLQKKQRRMSMNNKEDSINKVDELVNRAQLAINDWQCSGETYYLRQAQANLGSALELARAARTAALAAEKAEIYSVGDDDMTFTLYDTPEEALKSARDNLTAGEIVAVIQWRESNWHPEISVGMLLDEFEEEACEDGGSASEYWSERIESKDMATARTELEQRLNAVLKDWIDEHKLEADWYKPTGMKLSYQFDGKSFKRI